MKTAELAPIYGELARVYDCLNKDFYEGKLPSAIITLQSQSAGGGHVYGWASKDRWIDIDGNKYYELNISAEYLTRDIYNLISTLNHEMVHIYCWENDIKDTSNNYRYHNKRFKTEAEKRGLVIEKAPTVGFSVTSPSDTFIEYIDKLDIGDVFKVSRFDPSTAADSESDKPKKRKKRPFYECPECGTTLRGKPGLKILCGECECAFEYKEFNEDNEDEV